MEESKSSYIHCRLSHLKSPSPSKCPHAYSTDSMTVKPANLRELHLKNTAYLLFQHELTQKYK